MLGHLVKFVGEDFDLIATLDIETKVQITTAYALGALAQQFQRATHTTRNEQACKECHNETNQNHARSPRHGGIERLISFSHRLFNDNSPIQGRNECVGAENLIA